MSHLVSVIIPVYNRENELKRAINSVLNQTFQNFEIIVVDDFSEININSIVISFNDPRILYYKLDKKRNANVCRNLGLKYAKGNYIAMLDSDDEWLPNHLSLRLDYISKTDYDYLYGEMKVIGDPYVVDKNNPTRLGHVTEFSQGATIFIKTDVFWKIGGYRHLYGEDGDFWERATNMGFKLKRVDFATYIYYRNPGSITDLMSKGIFK